MEARREDMREQYKGFQIEDFRLQICTNMF
jgi:hypothetical protein